MKYTWNDYRDNERTLFDRLCEVVVALGIGMVGYHLVLFVYRTVTG